VTAHTLRQHAQIRDGASRPRHTAVSIVHPFTLVPSSLFQLTASRVAHHAVRLCAGEAHSGTAVQAGHVPRHATHR